MQEDFDAVIQKFRLPAYVKNAHKDLKKVFFDDGSVIPLQAFLTQLGITLDDAVFMSSPLSS